jgi:uncharacterized protein YbjT (DUF2867 family)
MDDTTSMRIAVIGGTGTLGRHVVDHLTSRGHAAFPVSTSTGVDVLSGSGLREALDGVDVVVDSISADRFDDAGATEFFETAEHTIAVAEQDAGVPRHVLVSVVGMDRIDAHGYLLGKVVQEAAVRESPTPSTIVRATQFFEFLTTVADVSETDGVVRVSTHDAQPGAAAEFAEVIAEVALHDPGADTVEIAGPERAPMEVFVRRALSAAGDDRPVVADAEAPYFGVHLEQTSLVPLGGYITTPTTQPDWLARRSA